MGYMEILISTFFSLKNSYLINMWVHPLSHFNIGDNVVSY